MFSIGPTAVSAFLQLVIFALTARQLGPGQFGQLAVIYGLTVVATDVAGLGGDGAMLRKVAIDPNAFATAWGHALTLLLASYVPVSLVTMILAGWFTYGALPWPVIAAIVFGEVLVGRVTAAVELVMVAHDQPVRASLVRLFTVAARALMAGLAFGLLQVSTTADWALVTLCQSVLCAVGLLGLVGWRYAPPRPRLDPGEVSFGLLLMLNQLSRSLNGNLDRIVLALFLTPAALGVYASGTRLLMVNGILNQAATRLFYARFFRAGASGRSDLRHFTLRTGRKMALVGICGGVLILGLAQLLPFVLGSDYDDSVWIASVLAFASPLISIQYPPADALTASNRQLVRTLVYFAVAIASGGLLAVGAMLGGVWGAIIGFLLSQAVLAAVLWVIFALQIGRREE